MFRFTPTSLRDAFLSVLQVAYVATHPDILQLLVLLGLCSAVGQTFIFYTIRTFDSLTLSTITTTRKFFTVRAVVLRSWPFISAPFVRKHCVILGPHLPPSPHFYWQIITSVAVHGHVLLTQQWVAVFVVFAGLALGE